MFLVRAYAASRPKIPPPHIYAFFVFLHVSSPPFAAGPRRLSICAALSPFHLRRAPSPLFRRPPIAAARFVFLPSRRSLPAVRLIHPPPWRLSHLFRTVLPIRAAPRRPSICAALPAFPPRPLPAFPPPSNCRATFRVSFSSRTPICPVAASHTRQTQKRTRHVPCPGPIASCRLSSPSAFSAAPQLPRHVSCLSVPGFRLFRRKKPRSGLERGGAAVEF